MIITHCNQKGGVGKTTLNLLGAYALARAGYSVAIDDRDPQQTATALIDTIGTDPVPLAQKGKSYDFLFIDTPGDIQSAGFAKAIAQSDRVALVTSPSPADIFSSRAALEKVKEHLRPDAAAALLFNRVQARTQLASGIDDITEQLNVRRLKAIIPLRQAYQRFTVLGWSVLTAKDLEPIESAMIELAKLPLQETTT